MSTTRLTAKLSAFLSATLLLPVTLMANGIQPNQYRSFFIPYYLVDKDSVTHVGKIIKSLDDRMLINTGAKIYVGNNNNLVDSGNEYAYSIIGKPESLGNGDFVVLKKGTAKLDRTYRNTLEMTITSNRVEIAKNDDVLAHKFTTQTLPNQSTEMDKKIDGKIIKVFGDTHYTGQHKSVLINIGKTQGIALGTKIYFINLMDKVDGFYIPPMTIGEGFVYRVANNHAMVLITHSSREISKETIVSTREEELPPKAEPQPEVLEPEPQPQSYYQTHYILPEGIQECSSETTEVVRESIGCYQVNGDQVTMHLDTKFAYDSADLSDQAEMAIQNLVRFMLQYDIPHITLEGYASQGMIGSTHEAYNIALSQRRTEAVRAYLISQGIQADEIDILAQGWNNPILPNDSDNNREVNQRVEASITVPLRSEQVKVTPNE